MLDSTNFCSTVLKKRWPLNNFTHNLIGILVLAESPAISKTSQLSNILIKADTDIPA